MRRGILLAIVATLALSSSSVVAQMTPCGDATIEYRGTVQSLSNSLPEYANCLSRSAGRDDCRIQFQALQADQTRFESVITTIRAECAP